MTVLKWVLIAGRSIKTFCMKRSPLNWRRIKEGGANGEGGEGLGLKN